MFTTSLWNGRKNSTRNPQRTLALPGTLVFIILWLTACGSPAPRTTDVGEPAIPQIGEPAELPQYPRSEYAGEFNAVEHLLAEHNWLGAAARLDQLPESLPLADDQYRRAYLRARIEYERGRVQEALVILDSLLVEPADPAVLLRGQYFRRHLLRSHGQWLDSARMQSALLQASHDPEAAAGLRRELWRDLQHANPAQLQAAREASGDPMWRGWLELALLDASHGGNTPTLTTALRQWQLENPQHPAAIALPGGLGELLATDTRLRQVTLMLPLSARLAPAAKAVRDGYLAAHYAAGSAGNITVVDLDQQISVTQAYIDAVNAGSELVVGPLSKEQLAELAAYPERNVPVLALNQLDLAPMQGSAALVQMSLSPTDEAQQLADTLYARGQRRVLLLHAGGPWGSTRASEFERRWQTLGGEVAASAGFSSSEDYASAIEQALALPESSLRARRVRDTLGQGIEFTPRRRGDVDAVVLMARNPQEARALRPLLAFYYAGELPVYATSHANDALPGADRDLNGLHLLEMPWLVGESSGLRQSMARDDSAQHYLRLQALGADAFLVQSRFAQLRAGPDVVLRGNTGLLTLDPQLQIRRELVPVKFDGGDLVSLTLD